MRPFLSSLNLPEALEDNDNFMAFKIPVSLWQTTWLQKACKLILNVCERKNQTFSAAQR